MSIILKGKSSVKLEALYQRLYFADCVLISSDKVEYDAHRVILAARSDVFEAMLGGNVKLLEVTENSKILALFLRLIYGMQCEGSYKDVMDLLIITRKYRMVDEHLMCIDALINTLDIYNAIELWMFSSEHGCARLKEKSFDFIVKNLNLIRNTANWNLLCNNPDYLKTAVEGYFDEVISQ